MKDVKLASSSFLRNLPAEFRRSVKYSKNSGLMAGSFLGIPIPLRKTFGISSALGYNARIVSEISAFGGGINCSCEMADALFLPAGRSPVSVKEL